MSTVSHHPHRGPRALIGLGVVWRFRPHRGPGLGSDGPVGGKCGHGGRGEQPVRGLFGPTERHCGGKHRARARPTPVREELSAFSLSTRQPPRGRPARPQRRPASSATATMAINRASVQLLSSVAAGEQIVCRG